VPFQASTPLSRHHPERAGRGPVGDAYHGTVVQRLTRDQVAHVARLAMLELSEGELETFTGQLAAVLAHAEDVEALDIGDDVPPTAHPYPLCNVFRPDTVQPSLPRDEVLAAAPATEAGRFKVPPALGEEP
jgi:aspartyl-tRNA(Asn)/glutamyl-tRNA(Gln) amidotransferase subunit C